MFPHLGRHLAVLLMLRQYALKVEFAGRLVLRGEPTPCPLTILPQLSSSRGAMKIWASLLQSDFAVLSLPAESLHVCSHSTQRLSLRVQEHFCYVVRERHKLRLT